MAIDRNQLFSGPVNILKIGGVDVGGTLGGVNVTQEDSWFEITCDQIFGISKKKLTDRRMRITFSVAEGTLANIQKAMAQPSANLSGSTLYFTDDEQGTIALEFEVDAPDGGGKRIYYFAICYISAGEHAYTKDGQTVYPVEVEALPDPDNSDRYGYVVAEAS